MKKFLNFPLILAFIFSFIISVCSLTGCEVVKVVEANTYSLKVDAGNVFITDPPRGEDGVADKRFKGGEVVTFSIGVVYDAEVMFEFGNVNAHVKHLVSPPSLILWFLSLYSS